MADTVTAFISASIDGVLTKDAANSPSSPSAGRRRSFTAYNLAGELLNSASYPALTAAPVDLSKTLAATTFDFDLTAAPLAEDTSDTIDLTGKKLVALLFYADVENAANLTIGPHPTTNGYPLFGTGIIQTIRPNQCELLFFPDTEDATFVLGMPAVAADAKVIRIAGTIGDSLQCIAYFGA